MCAELAHWLANELADTNTGKRAERAGHIPVATATSGLTIALASDSAYIR